MVISLEVERLARNNVDWHHLVYLCRWTDTLIADGHIVYDPQLSADRMVLGIRGQMSELELDTSIHRMVEARWNKARREELFTVPPADYDVDDVAHLVITCDEAVAHAIRTVFVKFAELGSARQVLLWWREQGLKFPVRRPGLRSHPVVWVDPLYRMIRSTLHHPVYAGASVFGRSQTRRELDSDGRPRLRLRRVQCKDWPVLIREHHPGYISFEQFLENHPPVGAQPAALAALRARLEPWPVPRRPRRLCPCPARLPAPTSAPARCARRPEWHPDRHSALWRALNVNCRARYLAWSPP